jgi:hypothetical protein
MLNNWWIPPQVHFFRENDDLSCIRTVYSDELFPWPAGKAPWSVEQGGTGFRPTLIPMKAANNVKTEMPQQQQQTAVVADPIGQSTGKRFEHKLG